MLRRFSDILMAGAGLVVLSPALFLTALVLWMTQGRPIFFVQQRAGLKGVPFPILKFRTMRRDAEKSGGTLTFKSDSRITPLGRFLRQTKIDEFPQLLNVLWGHMTIIGPRPEVLDWVARYTAEQREALSVKPGLSDPVQLFFRREQEFLNSAEEYERLVAIKIRKQIEYLRSRNACSDARVILKTIRTIFPSSPSAEEIAIYKASQAEAAADASRKTISL